MEIGPYRLPLDQENKHVCLFLLFKSQKGTGFYRSVVPVLRPFKPSLAAIGSGSPAFWLMFAATVQDLRNGCRGHRVLLFGSLVKFSGGRKSQCLSLLQKAC